MVTQTTSHSLPARPRIEEASARTPLDTAVGVLIGRRHCSPRAAFTEIADAALQSGIGLSALSRALVALASGVPTDFAHREEVEARWGPALGLGEPR
ncbi:putative RNA-binding protein [Mycolicibacterium chubuense NBB4]|uniref:Putative RNA-binding protein n=1 Tax=Mycolicibacterium chubuense (strain NBB4) TaxID=710421 RepID=I4BEX2_MYCCN|nr:ANTAR domain-containing protein [Mycolicibacterium chubuense]AFM15829.1 putative RNA-binding protein [Mycolicibacterium chubuense NBB4]